jgi:hypothetical protein
MIAQESKRGTSRGRRQAVSLGSGLEKSLSAYATAAIAAGVSLLATTRSAEAKIVYTPAYTSIPVNNRESVLLDLNHDGVADFSFWNLKYHGSEGEFRWSMEVGCAAVAISRSRSFCRYEPNQIWGKGGFASALRPGVKVGANKSYFQRGRTQWGWYYRKGPVANMAGYGGRNPSGQTSDGTWGQWMYTKDRYLGLQFLIAGQVHYGWARLTVGMLQIGGGFQATITGYAYETIPNKPIVTGKTKGPDVITLEPASLGRLAQGASGVSGWREKK